MTKYVLTTAFHYVIMVGNGEKFIEVKLAMEAEVANEILETIESRETNALYGFPMREPDRRRNPNGRSVDIKQLWSRHKEIIQLDRLGYKGTEIAKLLNITPESVSQILNSTLGQNAREVVREIRDQEYDDLHDDVIELTKKSLLVYGEILDDTSESRKLRKEVADTVTLELAGMRAPTKIESKSTTAVLTAEELTKLKDRGKAAALNAGKLIEVNE